MPESLLQSDLLAADDAVAIALYQSIRNHAQFGATALHGDRSEESIRHISSAFTQINQEILAVLFAHRAHAYEKLRQYDNMLADAKQVIEHNPTSAQGYLQAARALRNKQDFKESLAICGTGLKTASADDPFYPALASFKESLAGGINRLLQRLPYDVLGQIFSQLSITGRMRCIFTCKGWRDALLNWPDMYKTMELSRVKPKRVLDCIAKIDGQRVREVIIGYWVDEQAIKVLDALCQRGYNQIRKLSLHITLNVFNFLFGF